MQIVLSADDFQSLSEDAQQQILNLLYGTPINPTVTGTEFKGLVDLTPEMVGKFMEGVGFWTRERLRLIAEHGGRATWELLDDGTNGELNQGFQSGVTRRIRKLLGDPSANLLGWREGYDEAGERDLDLGEFYVTHETQRALLAYFHGQDKAERK